MVLTHRVNNLLNSNYVFQRSSIKTKPHYSLLIKPRKHRLKSISKDLSDYLTTHIARRIRAVIQNQFGSILLGNHDHIGLAP